jgi:Mg2+/citrate symporter
MAFVKKFWRSEEGVVESTLVVIPLMVLFLFGAGLIVAVNYRNLDLAYAQTDATSGAITSVVSNGNEVISFSSFFGSDALRILITHRRRILPNVIPYLPFLNENRVLSTDVTGIAVMERQP